MKKFWIFVIVVVVAGAAWEYRDRIPYLSTLTQTAAKGDGTQNDGDKQASAQGGSRRGNGAPAVVKTVAAETSTLPLDVTATGVADADENTTIAAQEAGIITSIAAHDGDVVKQGDLIAKLDDRTAVADRSKDRALLLRDQATLAQAETALTRAENLLQRAAGTQQSADEAKAARDTAAATIESDKAAIAADEIVVEHTEIRAPFDGRLGDITPSVGAYLTVGAAVVTIAKYDPIYVNFHIPEGYLDDVRAGFAAGNVTVDAMPQTDSGKTITGKLNFFDNTVDAASGTILAKARFDNPNGTLWPGQSVNVVVHFKSDEKYIVVPTVAVQPGAKSFYVYTVGDDKKVHMTPVTVARANGDKTAISKGVTEGTHVVVEGQVQLADGVNVHEQFENGLTNGTAENSADGSIEVGDAQ